MSCFIKQELGGWVSVICCDVCVSNDITFIHFQIFICFMVQKLSMCEWENYFQKARVQCSVLTAERAVDHPKKRDIFSKYYILTLSEADKLPVLSGVWWQEQSSSAKIHLDATGNGVLQRSTLLFILNAPLVVTDETMVGLIPNMLFLWDGAVREVKEMSLIWLQLLWHYQYNRKTKCGLASWG